MAIKIKAVTCFVSEDELSLIKRRAREEERSISNLIYAKLRKSGLLPSDLENSENKRIMEQFKG